MRSKQQSIPVRRAEWKVALRWSAWRAYSTWLWLSMRAWIWLLWISSASSFSSPLQHATPWSWLWLLFSLVFSAYEGIICWTATVLIVMPRTSQFGGIGLGPHTPSTCAGTCNQLLYYVQGKGGKIICTRAQACHKTKPDQISTKHPRKPDVCRTHIASGDCKHDSWQTAVQGSCGGVRNTPDISLEGCCHGW